MQKNISTIAMTNLQSHVCVAAWVRLLATANIPVLSSHESTEGWLSLDPAASFLCWLRSANEQPLAGDAAHHRTRVPWTVQHFSLTGEATVVVRELFHEFRQSVLEVVMLPNGQVMHGCNNRARCQAPALVLGSDSPHDGTCFPPLSGKGGSRGTL